uniref:Tetraspanin-4-like n=1 Tax=Gopherus evgoodei TaxID=1825980 RepID=A0A8C4WSA6_9SAUR
MGGGLTGLNFPAPKLQGNSGGRGGTTSPPTPPERQGSEDIRGNPPVTPLGPVDLGTDEGTQNPHVLQPPGTDKIPPPPIPSEAGQQMGGARMGHCTPPGQGPADRRRGTEQRGVSVRGTGGAGLAGAAGREWGAPAGLGWQGLWVGSGGHRQSLGARTGRSGGLRVGSGGHRQSLGARTGRSGGLRVGSGGHWQSWGELPQRCRPPTLLAPLPRSSCTMGPTQRCLLCLKVELFIFNLIFWLGGCGALGVGLWLALSQGRFSALSLSLPSLGVAGLVMAAGAVVMAVGFLGCLGAATEQRCLLLTFFVVLLTIVLLELSGGLAFYACRGQFDRYAQEDLKSGLRRYGAPGEPALTQAWDTVQTEVSPPSPSTAPCRFPPLSV